MPWFADIANDLATSKIPVHLPKHEKQRIIQQSANYSWAGNDLFRTSLDLIIRKCAREDEMYDILQACHNGPCGGRFPCKHTAYKVLHQRYYFPTLFKDVAKYVRSCDSFQRMGRPTSSTNTSNDRTI